MLATHVPIHLIFVLYGLAINHWADNSGLVNIIKKKKKINYFTCPIEL